MGLFDKLFGGGDAKQPDPTPAAPPPPPSADGAPVARRERSKPQPAPTPASTGPAAVPISPDAENVDLLNAIAGVVNGDSPDTRNALYTAILAAELYLVSMPTEGDDNTLPAGEITLQEGQQLSLATIRNPQGQIFLPAFTDVERLSHTLPEGEKAPLIRIGASAVCRMFLQGQGEGIVINPGQPPSGVITRAEAEILAAGALPELDEHGQFVGQAQQQMNIVIGKPDVPPAQSLVDAILSEAPRHEIVREIHIFKAGIQGQPPRLMIGLLVDDGLTPDQMHPSFEAIGKAAYDARGETDAFDMMPLNAQLLDAIRSLEAIIYSRDQQV